VPTGPHGSVGFSLQETLDIPVAQT
jgi:hypothetical protein